MKKLYFTISSIMQMIGSFIVYFTSKDIINDVVDYVINDNMSSFALTTIKSSLLKYGPYVIGLTSLLIVFFNLFILIEVLNDHLDKHKNKIIAFSTIAMLLTQSTVVLIFAFANIILILFKSKIGKVKKKPKILGVTAFLSYFIIQIFTTLIVRDNLLLSQITGDVLTIATMLYLFSEELKNGLNKIRKNIKQSIKDIIINQGFIFIIYLLACVVVSLILKDDASKSVNQQLLETLPMWYLAPAAVIVAPIVEELVFRGAIRKIISKNKILYILISGLIFGLLHTIGEDNILNAIILMIPYATLGSVFAYIYSKSDNIIYNISNHALYNLFIIILMIVGLN